MTNLQEWLKPIYINPKTYDAWDNSFWIEWEKTINLSYTCRVALFSLVLEDYQSIIKNILDWEILNEDQIIKATKWKSKMIS